MFVVYLQRIFKVYAMAIIIGREVERRQLNLLAKSSKAEFVAVYGRRRVGKTYLITEHFRDSIAFTHQGCLMARQSGRKRLFAPPWKKSAQAEKKQTVG